jgi:hypothetical protein
MFMIMLKVLSASESTIRRKACTGCSTQIDCDYSENPKGEDVCSLTPKWGQEWESVELKSDNRCIY